MLQDISALFMRRRKVMKNSHDARATQEVSLTRQLHNTSIISEITGPKVLLLSSMSFHAYR